MIQDEIPKYLKQKESNISKSNRKSKHKHRYKECLIQYPIIFAGKSYTKTGLYNYCTICGKIGGNIDPTRDVVEHVSGKHLRMLSKEEILEQNKDLEIFDIGNMFAKYVPLNKEEK